MYIGAIDAQINWGNNSDPREIFEEGNVYVVEDVEVHSQHTKLTFKGISGKFNSVHFKSHKS